MRVTEYSGIAFRRQKYDGENKNVVGIKNEDLVLAIHKLTSINSVPAISNGGKWTGPIVLIDSGKTTLYFPHGKYKLNRSLIVRGNIRRIIGFHSPVRATKALLRFENNAHPVLLERFNFFDGVKLERAASQPVVVRHSIGPVFSTTSKTGTWFIENVVTSRLNIGKGQNVYARQLNCESPPPGPLVKNEGGLVWLFGYKTEFGNTVAATLNGGKTEILGGLFYPAQGVEKRTKL